jgi:hypothetical protein
LPKSVSSKFAFWFVFGFDWRSSFFQQAFWLIGSFAFWSKSKLRVKFSQVGGVVFLGKGSGQRAGCLTKRAPDVWESARFTSIFLASGFSYISNIIHARPHAGNASR